MTEKLSGTVKPILLLACGNPSRGDDALGPLLLEWVAEHCDLGDIELLLEFQWQVENTFDLQNRAKVIFVDASLRCVEPFEFGPLLPEKGQSYSTHAMNPSAVMAVYPTITSEPLPDCYLLSIKGKNFELGTGLSESAAKHLQQAGDYLVRWLQQ